MKRKIFANMIVIAILAVLVTGLFVVWIFYHDMQENMQREAAVEAQYMKAAVDKIGVSYLEQVLSPQPPNSSSRITLIDVDGTVLLDNCYDPSEMGNHLERPEVQMALDDGVGTQVRISQTLDEQTYYYAVKLENGMVLRLANTSSSVLASMVSTLPLLLAIAAGILLLLIFLSNRLVNVIVAPVNELDLEHPLDNVTYDELQPLLKRISKQNKTIQLQIEELKVKQREFTALTENMSEGFLVVDAQSNVLSYNTSALDLLGIHELVGDRQNILTFNRNARLQAVIESALEGNSREEEVHLEGRYCQVIANPVTSRKQIQGVVVVIWDITEHHEREQMRREFSANVSHELKTPLTSISGYAEIIKNGLVRSEDIPRFAENIYNETARLITMVGDIIRLSQLDEKEVNLQQEKVDLYQLCEDTLNRLQPMAEKRNIAMKLEGQPQVINGVRQILNEMIYNLCINAVTYNRDDGEVKVSVNTIHGCTVLAVEDTGIGIPAEDQDRVFERFYRVDKSHSKQAGGTGLGLSIVKHGAIFHGASIELKSRVNEGTCIQVIWPKEA
ncbi:MAG: ATP-binding protein [Lachnospiraceae bacterium]|jgi:two-component system phosphate regulon sensor histidine kinase PhoR